MLELENGHPDLEFFVTQMVKTLPAMRETLPADSACNGLGIFPREGNGYPLQYTCLENFIDIRPWQATAHGVAESDMTDEHHFFTFFQTPS